MMIGRRWQWGALVVMGLAWLAGCEREDGAGGASRVAALATTGPASRPAQSQPVTQPQTQGVATMMITSSSFEVGRMIPKMNSGEGENHSPEISWSGLPVGTEELALICDDPDAPMAEPFVHWVIFNIDPTTKGLPEGVAKVELPPQAPGAKQGVNSAGKIGYTGPMPPPGHGVHHYHFTLYALDAPMQLTGKVDKKALLKAMDKHILGKAELVGTYERKKSKAA